MLRFLTVRDARAARNSAAVAISIFTVFFLMLPMFGYAALNEIGKKAIVAANAAGDSAGPMLAQEVGGDILYALVAGVTIATRSSPCSPAWRLRSGAPLRTTCTRTWSRRATSTSAASSSRSTPPGAVSAGIAIVLALGAKDLNIANVANVAFAIAASTTMPTLLLTIYWRRFNQMGALFAMVGGLIVSLVLVFLGPDGFGKDDAIFPLAIPAIVWVPAVFLFAYIGTLIEAGASGPPGCPTDEFERRAFAPARRERRSASPAGPRSPSGSARCDGRRQALPRAGRRRAAARRRGVPRGRRGPRT